MVRFGHQVVDEVRRRVQQTTLSHRGYNDDPLYQAAVAPASAKHLSDRQQCKLNRCLDADDPTGEGNVTWQCYQQHRSIFHAGSGGGPSDRRR